MSDLNTCRLTLKAGQQIYNYETFKSLKHYMKLCSKPMAYTAVVLVVQGLKGAVWLWLIRIIKIV